MSARKRRKYKPSSPWLTVSDTHSGAAFIHIDHFIHVRKIQFRIDAIHEHIHGKRDDIAVSGSFTITEEGPLYSLRPCQKSQFGSSNTCSTVIMGMNRYDDRISVFCMCAEILDHIGKYVRHRHFNGFREINDDFILRCRFPDIKHGIDDLHGKFRLGLGEVLRGVFKMPISITFISIDLCLDQFCAFYRQLFTLLFIKAEYDFALESGCSIIQVNDRRTCAAYGLKCLMDNIFTGHCQYLNCDITRDDIIIDQMTCKLIFRVGRSRIPDLNRLETEFDKIVEELDLLVKIHRDFQCLVSVP